MEEPSEDACRALRVVLEGRRAESDRARERADRAAASLRDARRALDRSEGALAVASRWRDPREVEAAKQEAYRRYRLEGSAAEGGDELGEVTGRWWAEIAQVNRRARDARAILESEPSRVAELSARVERLRVAADAARIAAEAAAERVAEAQAALHACLEPAVGSAPGQGAGWSADLLRRLLAGERKVLLAAAASLAHESYQDEQAYQLLLAELVELVATAALEAYVLDFPDEHRLWRSLGRAERREVAAALGGLGYRPDGRGGWSDGRIPDPRALSLAFAYAGLDPLRLRPWPSPAETAELYRDVRVAVDEFLATAGGELSSAALRRLLGARAARLADLWPGWDRLAALTRTD